MDSSFLNIDKIFYAQMLAYFIGYIYIWITNY